MEKQRIEIMGIVNVNDDSFFAQSRAKEKDAFIARVETMLEQGADSIDIGAVSTRPNMAPVSLEQEWERLSPVVQLFALRFAGVRFSVDTYRKEIVSRVYEVAGPFVVNDISAGEEDPGMLERVAELDLEYIAMHRKGDCVTMHHNYEYEDVVEEVADYFRKFGEIAAAKGVRNWILDPGFGFSKSIEDNYLLFKGLPELKKCGRRILVGISRKRMIYQPLGITPEESLEAVTALHLQALLAGADILRVHDVAAARGCVTLYDFLK
jgi:dihydropteroate synthase